MSKDLISRQAAIDAGLRLCGRGTKAELINLCEASIADSEGWAGGILDYMGELEDLPSAQPERKNGEWIDTDTVWTAIVGDNSFNIPAKMCSECKKPIAQIMWNNFCPNCGARMEGGE